ncbi:MAG: TetR/AcrR family transcriptional regulator [Pelagimonas sp.]|uniref:TetR/AcrR family transcriptional regulator n=1 Tax=Pelagimonas sp. TaxID=2073170 RepID=UPI003D6A560A
MQKRLSQEDWLAAGFRALAQGGPSAIRAEAIARDLKTTKGSFYWHFKDLKAFKTAMLTLWKDKATDAIIANLQDLPKGHNQLLALIKTASHAPDRFGGIGVEPAIREWARTDPDAEAALIDVDKRRISFLHEQLTRLGTDADMTHARLFYAAHLGLEQLARTTGERGEIERHLLLSLMQADKAG